MVNGKSEANIDAFCRSGKGEPNCNVCGHELKYHKHTLFDIVRKTVNLPKQYDEKDLESKQGVMKALELEKTNAEKKLKKCQDEKRKLIKTLIISEGFIKKHATVYSNRWILIDQIEKEIEVKKLTDTSEASKKEVKKLQDLLGYLKRQDKLQKENLQKLNNQMASTKRNSLNVPDTPEEMNKLLQALYDLEVFGKLIRDAKNQHQKNKTRYSVIQSDFYKFSQLNSGLVF